MISVHRHSQLMKTFQETQNLSESARQAGIDRKTARDYIETGRPPGKPKVARNWKTRADPFEEVWPEIEALLLKNTKIQATSLFDDLQARYPGRFPDGQLRTLQRKVGQWREANQEPPSSEIYFEQVHVPGRLLQLDWFHPKIYEVTIRGAPFKHQICHSVLTYSNWEHATICHSESLLSLQEALQDTLWALGGVPSILQTDNSSTATHTVGGKGKKREFNTRYLSTLNYFSIQPQTINVRKAHENGDVESSHQHYRKAIADALTLRGSHDFESQQAFQSWLDKLSEKRNLNRQAKFEQEQSRLRPLPAHRLPDFQRLSCRVNKYGMARVGKSSYSVPAEARNRQLHARRYERHLEIWDEQQCILRCEQQNPAQGQSLIDWRHLIGDLARKPGAFRRYRWREQFFPSELWRRAYHWLEDRYGATRADSEYLNLLLLAREEGEQRLELLLTQRLASKELSLDMIRRDLGKQQDFRELGGLLDDEELKANLSKYDKLLSEPDSLSKNIESKPTASRNEGHA